MTIVCILLGILEIVAAIITFVNNGGMWLNFVLGIAYIVSGLVFFYIAFLGFRGKQNEAKIQELEDEIEKLNQRYEYLLAKSKANNTNVKVFKTNNGKPMSIDTAIKIANNKDKVVLLKDMKSLNGEMVPTGNEGTIMSQKDDIYTIEIVGEDKTYLVECKEEDFDRIY
jgi:hypothetical protein